MYEQAWWVSFLEKIKHIYPRRSTYFKWFLVLVGLGMVVLGLGLYVLDSPQAMTACLPTKGWSDLDEGDSSASSSASSQKQLTIDINGAVVKPGVYQLPSGSRYHDAILAAGGLDKKNVEKRFIAKELNLSKTIQDQEKIYVPFAGETTLTTKENDQISVNSASESELQRLKGVGAVTATKIIDLRPFKSLEDFGEKISKKIYEDNRQILVL